ncbi:uncharacterized protein LOC143570433 [Bidens hawaiensis]|uniref:uncharacterized protein LOC143570433 n=1 Tax=Bidens hawaiensis TaxID=980011 RepID=UPI00404A5DA6
MKTKRSDDDIDGGNDEKMLKMEEMVVLGVDGGGTSTRCVCAVLPKRDLVAPHKLQVLGGYFCNNGCNPNSVGETKAHETLKSALARSGKQVLDVRAMCLGVSGVDNATDVGKMKQWLSTIFPDIEHLYVFNDAVVALASGAEYGCVLISGIGCIAYGCTADGRWARAAGLGPLLGDRGSGCGIATEAVMAILKAHDGRVPETKLEEAILELLKFSSPDNLVGWIYEDSSWARIARLAPQVFSVAKAGDVVAQGILDDAVTELAASVKAVVKKLALGGEDGMALFAVVLVGGVLDSAVEIGEKVLTNVMEAYLNASIVKPQCRLSKRACVKPAYGAAWLACKKERERKQN